MVTAKEAGMSIGDKVKLTRLSKYIRDVPDIQQYDTGVVQDISDSGKMVLFDKEGAHDLWVYTKDVNHLVE